MFKQVPTLVVRMWTMIFKKILFSILFLQIFVIALGYSQEQFCALSVYAQHEKAIKSKEVSIIEGYLFIRFKQKTENGNEDLSREGDGMFYVQDKINEYIFKGNTLNLNGISSSRLKEEFQQRIEGNINYKWDDIPMQVVFNGDEGDYYYYTVGIEEKVLDSVFWRNK